VSGVLAVTRTLAAVALRDWRISRRYPAAFVTLLFWPLVLPAVYVLQATAYGGDPRSAAAFAARTGTVQVAGFLYVGGAMYMWLTQVLWGPGTALRQEQQRGSLEQFFLTPASRVALLFGSAPPTLITTGWMFLVIAVALRFGFGLPLSGEALLRAAGVFAISAPALFGMSALFAAAVLRFREVNAAVQLVRGLCQLLCGITFPIAVLPDWARAVALALPPTYVIEDMRRVLLAGASLASMSGSLALLGAFAVGLGGLGAVAFAAAERSGRRTGSLGQH
jgi:ABC-2 type transport system permease protein